MSRGRDAGRRVATPACGNAVGWRDVEHSVPEGARFIRQLRMGVSGRGSDIMGVLCSERSRPEGLGWSIVDRATRPAFGGRGAGHGRPRLWDGLSSRWGRRGCSSTARLRCSAAAGRPGSPFLKYLGRVSLAHKRVARSAWGRIGFGALTGFTGSDRMEHGLGLAEVLLALRSELQQAIVAGQGQDVRFRLGTVDLEFQVVLTREGEGQGGIKFWVLELGASARVASTATQTLKLQLTPVDRRGGPLDASSQWESRPE